MCTDQVSFLFSMPLQALFNLQDTGPTCQQATRRQSDSADSLQAGAKMLAYG